ncbi:hypothetical protein DFA_01164 [Cavenderia fasciculata]|uniref:F-box domain-containing protein n=1 Tax=Cavenderia fasciculata TaxID=261658 RepID=F4PR83_CACFS|nr:uncharacterized protein DFA_01164 [Cavenderia fasciculata]EGG21283.1 hypothetical protein DFA_01164 [Cavenderia fasciculata]|eukprot:XP_004359133.1 hypothetical protein DFA_01164 [Cavenderia fasciculata]
MNSLINETQMQQQSLTNKKDSSSSSSSESSIMMMMELDTNDDDDDDTDLNHQSIYQSILNNNSLIKPMVAVPQSSSSSFQISVDYNNYFDESTTTDLELESSSSSYMDIVKQVHLPREVWIIVLGYLSERDLIMISYVDHSLNYLSQDNYLWKSLYLRKWNVVTLPHRSKLTLDLNDPTTHSQVFFSPSSYIKLLDLNKSPYSSPQSRSNIRINNNQNNQNNNNQNNNVNYLNNQFHSNNYFHDSYDENKLSSSIKRVHEKGNDDNVHHYSQSTPNGAPLLRFYLFHWQNYLYSIKRINIVFRYYHRDWVSKQGEEFNSRPLSFHSKGSTWWKKLLHGSESEISIVHLATMMARGWLTVLLSGLEFHDNYSSPNRQHTEPQLVPQQQQDAMDFEPLNGAVNETLLNPAAFIQPSARHQANPESPVISQFRNPPVSPLLHAQISSSEKNPFLENRLVESIQICSKDQHFDLVYSFLISILHLQEYLMFVGDESPSLHPIQHPSFLIIGDQNFMDNHRHSEYHHVSDWEFGSTISGMSPIQSSRCPYCTFNPNPPQMCDKTMNKLVSKCISFLQPSNQLNKQKMNP